MKNNHAMRCKLLKISIAALITATALASCTDITPATPKPKAYMRFDFAEKSYTLCDTAALPFTFEKASGAKLYMKRNTAASKWVDIVYGDLGGVMFLTYKPMAGSKELPAQIDTAYEMLTMHFDHSSGIDEKAYSDDLNHVWATTYQLKGRNTASTFQFWATDSCHHFLRGSLYLNCTPNNDSLAPVLEYLQQDARHLLETLRWR